MLNNEIGIANNELLSYRLEWIFGKDTTHGDLSMNLLICCAHGYLLQAHGYLRWILFLTATGYSSIE